MDVVGGRGIVSDGTPGKAVINVLIIMIDTREVPDDLEIQSEK